MKKSYAFIMIVTLLKLNSWAQAPNISYATPQTYSVGVAITPLSPINTGGAVGSNIATFAGLRKDLDGQDIYATFYQPSGVAVDASGTVYVADTSNHKIRKISPSGVVSTLAGSGIEGSADGMGISASFSYPYGVAVDASGTVYVADRFNHKIRKISPSGEVSTLAGSGIEGSDDGTGTSASFESPIGVAVDASGTVYVADSGNHKIRKITPSGVVSTLAGSGTWGSANGTGTSASFASPSGVAVDASGTVYVVDCLNYKIRKISPAGEVSTLAGNGTIGSVDGTDISASFYNPWGVAVDASGTVYVTDSGNYKIRKISPSGMVSTFAGGTTGNADGTGTSASFANPTGVAVDASGTVYVADTQNNKIRKISPSGEVSTLAGGSLTYGSADGMGASASFKTPYGIAVDASGTVYVADTNNNKIRKISPSGAVSTLAGSGVLGSVDGTGTSANFNSPTGVAVDASGIVYVADSANNKIRKISPSGVVSTLAGSGIDGSADGMGASASFYSPFGIAVDASGTVYVADTNNNKIRKISPSGMVSTLAGSGIDGSADGMGASASFYGPTGVAVDASGVYVADWGNDKIRKISPSGEVSTLAGSDWGSADGTGNSASFYGPTGVAVDASGTVYVADTQNNKIRKISPSGVVSTLAGSGATGNADGMGISASFYNPNGVAVDVSGAIYVADTQNNQIRMMEQYGYSISPNLPAGLSFNTDTGIISGTPTVAIPATTYTITAYNSAGSNSTTISIETALLGIGTFTMEGLKLYPNPTNSFLNLQTPNNISFDKIRITDLMGKTVMEQNQSTSQINVEKLPCGMYIIEAFSEEQKFTAKFVKE